MSTWKRYILAESVEEAVNALYSSPGQARPVAGGTDLLLELQQGHHPPVDTLVDVTRIPELNRLEARVGRLWIGAAVPVAEVTGSPLVCAHAQAAAEACGLIGGPQVRNTATLGGNVAHALPAADGMIGLVSLDAQAHIAGWDAAQGVVTRSAPILSLFRGPGKNTLAPSEIITGFSLALAAPGEASAFRRVMRPQGVALPILNLAIWLRREGPCLADIRVAVGPAGPVPQRASAVEDNLRGALLGDPAGWDAALSQALEVWRGTMRFRTSPRRSGSAYRSHLSEGLLADVLRAAWQRAAQPQAQPSVEVAE